MFHFCKIHFLLFFPISVNYRKRRPGLWGLCDEHSWQHDVQDLPSKLRLPVLQTQVHQDQLLRLAQGVLPQQEGRTSERPKRGCRIIGVRTTARTATTPTTAATATTSKSTRNQFDDSRRLELIKSFFLKRQIILKDKYLSHVPIQLALSSSNSFKKTFATSKMICGLDRCICFLHFQWES